MLYSQMCIALRSVKEEKHHETALGSRRAYVCGYFLSSHRVHAQCNVGDAVAKLELVESQLPTQDYTYANVLIESDKDHSTAFDTSDMIDEALTNWQIAQECLFAAMCVIITMAITLLCVICYSAMDTSVVLVQ